MHFNFFSLHFFHRTFRFHHQSMQSSLHTENAEPINRASPLSSNANAKHHENGIRTALVAQCQNKWIEQFLLRCFPLSCSPCHRYDIKRMNVFRTECNFYVIACELMIYCEPYSRTRRPVVCRQIANIRVVITKTRRPTKATINRIFFIIIITHNDIFLRRIKQNRRKNTTELRQNSPAFTCDELIPVA